MSEHFDLDRMRNEHFEVPAPQLFLRAGSISPSKFYFSEQVDVADTRGQREIRPIGQGPLVESKRQAGWSTSKTGCIRRERFDEPGSVFRATLVDDIQIFGESGRTMHGGCEPAYQSSMYWTPADARLSNSRSKFVILFERALACTAEHMGRMLKLDHLAHALVGREQEIFTQLRSVEIGPSRGPHRPLAWDRARVVYRVPGAFAFVAFGPGSRSRAG
ncbi:MAG: hypothetical protein ACR2RL_08250 [Gammaproteobacteria bacterium]